MTVVSRLRTNLAEVRERIAAACDRAERNPAVVTLVAVTKYAQWSWVRELPALGVADLGESRPQQLVERAALPDTPVNWHLVGHLQRNKARRVLPAVSLIHSVDSLRLLQTLDRLAGEQQCTPRVLLEVNVAGESAKHGFQLDQLETDWNALLACRRVQIDGLMTMAPRFDDPEAARPVFRELRELRNRLRQNSALPLPELSMGMSGDFEVAVEEGATIVRIGSRLFAGLE